MIDDEHYLDLADVVLVDLIGRLRDAGLHRQTELAECLRRRPVRPPTLPDVAAAPPVVDHLSDAFPTVDAENTDERLWEALRALAPVLPWTRTAAYLREPPNAGFLDRYSHTTILGPPDGEGGSSDSEEAALGAVLLGPGVHYPLHRHPADEVYLPLGVAAWLHGEGQDPVEEPVGRLLHHQPWQPHAMTVDGDRPVLLVYLWTGDVRTAATWCDSHGEQDRPTT